MYVILVAKVDLKVCFPNVSLESVRTQSCKLYVASAYIVYNYHNIEMMDLVTHT